MAQISGTFGRATGELTELSLGGAFVAGISLPAQSRVRVHMLLPHSNAPVEAPAIVLYERAASASSAAGLGLAFDALPQMEATRVERAVQESDLRMTELLFRLQMEGLSRDDLDSACIDAGLPAGLSRDEISLRVDQAIRRFHGDL